MLATHDVRTTEGLKVGVATRQGAARAENQDCYDFDPEGRWFVVADGIGGHPGGAEASRLVCDLLGPALEDFVDFPSAHPAERLQHLVAEVRDDFLHLRKSLAEHRHMGTTVLVGVVVGGTLYVAWLGDSRALLVRRDRVRLLTHDHRLVDGLVERGLLSRRRAADHPWRNVLYKYVGATCDDNAPDVATVELRPGDRIVLGTDGVTDHLESRHVGAIVGHARSAEAAAGSLVRAVVRTGSTDDATCLVGFVSADEPVKEPWPFNARFLGPMHP